jgi:hypothetical protein
LTADISKNRLSGSVSISVAAAFWTAGQPPRASLSFRRRIPMKSRFLSLFGCALLVAASVVVSPGVSAAPGASRIEGETAVQIGGTVSSVNLATRTVMIADAQGAISSVQVGQDVPNLDRLANGTRVTASTMRGVTLTILAKGALAANNTPVAEVVRADDRSGVITLKDAQGGQLVVRVREPLMAAGIAAGTRVAVEFAALTAAAH